MLIFDVKVVPSSGQNKWILDKSGMLKCYLKNAPEKGKANKELVQLLAYALRISQADIELVAGVSSRRKKIKINKKITYEMLLRLLNLDTGQKSIF